ncbi:Hyaluronidase PH-20, partial, partial [Pelobates cultripes]
MEELKNIIQANNFIMALVKLFLLTSVQQPIQALSPLQDQFSFVSIWNAPTELCAKKFNINVDLSLFEIIGSTLRSAKDQNITIFYSDRLGYYPSINPETGNVYNGGIPQMTNMHQHLKKAQEDIISSIPSVTQSGLAVIDWEDWRPTWIRNWAFKDIYRRHSTEFALQQDLELPERNVKSVAKRQFEQAAKNLMLSTLRLGKSLRPQYLWGFYLFPNCQNYDYKTNRHSYSGHCPEIEKMRNDGLYWLWKESTALFPNMYLESTLKSSRKAALFVRNRIKEAKRVSRISNSSSTPPVYMYSRPVFTDNTQEYLSEVELANLILYNESLTSFFIHKFSKEGPEKYELWSHACVMSTGR